LAVQRRHWIFPPAVRRLFSVLIETTSKLRAVFLLGKIVRQRLETPTSLQKSM